MECPWESFRQEDLEFCERNLCSWLKEPSNTSSNIGYVIVGLLIWYSTRKTRPLISWIGIAAIMTGLGSAFFHASGIYWAGVADYAGMFLGTGIMTTLNVKRWFRLEAKWLYLVMTLTTLALIGLKFFFPGAERLIYVLAMPCCLLELSLFFRDRKHTRYKLYLLGWGAVLVGTVFWWLDVSGILCNPDNHWLTGHGMWHLTTAIAFYFFYRFYLQFPRVAGQPRNFGCPTDSR